jgi:hypothetical protein
VLPWMEAVRSEIEINLENKDNSMTTQEKEVL